MAVRNGEIYGDISANPPIGVSIADVQSCVPVTIKRTVNGVTERRNSSDLGVLIGGKVGDQIQDNAGGTAWRISSRIEINKWAKYKPIKCSGLGRQGYAKRVETNFGITYIPVFVSKLLGNVAKYVFDRIVIGSGQAANIPQCDINRPITPDEWEYWVYDKPTGGSASPYRLSDFRSADEMTYTYLGVTKQINGGAGDVNKGYFHRATPPLQELNPDDGTRANGSSILNAWSDGCFSFVFKQGLEGVTAGLTVRYEDLFMGQGIDIANYYFGILFRAVGGEDFFAITQRQTAGDQGGTWAMGNTVRFALRATGTSMQKTAEQILGRGLSGEIEYVPFMSSRILSAEQQYTEYYPMENFGNESGTFLLLDMVPRREYISITKARAEIIDLTGFSGRITAKDGIRVTFKLKSVTSETISVKVTVKVYQSYVQELSDLIGVKTVTYNGITGTASADKSIEMVKNQGQSGSAATDELPSNCTPVMATISVEPTGNSCFFKEETHDVVFFDNSSSGGGGGGDHPTPIIEPS